MKNMSKFVFNTMDTAPTDGTEILIKTHIGLVTAWFHIENQEWVCYDDMFSLESDDPNIIGWIALDMQILPDKFKLLMRILTQSENQKHDELLKDVLDLLCGITKCPSPCDICPLYSIKNLTDFLQSK